MTGNSWEQVADDLAAHLARPLQVQSKLAQVLGLTLAPDTPAPVAAAILSEAVAEALMRAPARFGGEIEHLRLLEQELEISPAVVDEESAAPIVSAWILCRYMEKRLRGLRELSPAPGDIVQTKGADSQKMIVSSIDVRGRVFMKGGRGLSAWPDNLVMVMRHGGGDDHAALAAQIRSDLANGRKDYSPESRLLEKLESYWVDELRPSALAVQELEDVLESGDGTEGPLQRLIERHPQLLAGTVVGNNGMYVIPQQALGAEYRVDFLVLGINSAGPQWLLVELEAPKHNLLNRDASLKTAVRHAVGQIQDWREWLTTNADYAQRQHGLHGITNQADGLVIIGRGQPSIERDSARNQAREQQKISIHSWDWILRQARELAEGAYPLGVYKEGHATATSSSEIVAP